MTDQPPNPPAFPTTAPLEHWGDPQQGMTLRDWFAGQALPGLLADGLYRRIVSEVAQSEHAHLIHDKNALAEFVCERIAIGVYRLADAMLIERNRK